MRFYSEALDKEEEQNAEVARNQEEYRSRKAELEEKLAAARAEYDATTEELQHAAVRHKQVRAMMAALEEQKGPLDGNGF